MIKLSGEGAWAPGPGCTGRQVLALPRWAGGCAEGGRRLGQRRWFPVRDKHSGLRAPCGPHASFLVLPPVICTGRVQPTKACRQSGRMCSAQWSPKNCAYILCQHLQIRLDREIWTSGFSWKIRRCCPAPSPGNRGPGLTGICELGQGDGFCQRPLYLLGVSPGGRPGFEHAPHAATPGGYIKDPRGSERF